MSIIAPAPSASRGELILQPNYFTSSIYVRALRHDISILILKYHEAYSQSASSNPFNLFKSLWLSQGWNWLHFKVFDDRSRQTFLDITLRLFLGEFCLLFCCSWPNKRVRKNGENRSSIHPSHSPVWALHIFLHSDKGYRTSPLLDESHNYFCRYVQVVYSYQKFLILKSNLDHYVSLKILPQVIATSHVRNLEPYTTFILSCLWKDQIFLILPKNELGPLNPRDLPRELINEGPQSGSEKRKGRPAWREKNKKARAALIGLDEWIAKPSTGQQDPSKENSPLHEYQTAKSSVINILAPEAAMDDVNVFVLERLLTAQQSVPIQNEETNVNVGVPRIKRAIESDGWGILHLLEGAGVV